MSPRLAIRPTSSGRRARDVAVSPSAPRVLALRSQLLWTSAPALRTERRRVRPSPARVILLVPQPAGEARPELGVFVKHATFLVDYSAVSIRATVSSNASMSNGFGSAHIPYLPNKSWCWCSD